MIGRYKIKDAYSLLIYIIVVIGIFSGYPYVFNVYLPIPSLPYIVVIVLSSLGFVCIKYKPCLKSLPNSFNSIVILQIVCWISYIIIHQDILYIDRIIYILVVYMMILCLYNCHGGLYEFFEKYDRFITVMAILGALSFFIVLITNMPPVLKAHNLDGRESYCYLFTCTNYLINNFIRMAGYFDEPGAMAYWGVWALLFNKVYYNNKKIELYLIIGLLFTFSIAYYIQLFIYFLFYKIRNFRQGVLITITIGLVVLGIVLLRNQYPVLYNLTLNRFEQDDSGQFKGDNRTNLMNIAKCHFESSPIFGIGSSIASQKEYMADNPYETLAVDGIIGAIITYLPLLYLWNLKTRKKYIMRFALIILGVGFLQRPFHHYILYYFIVYGFSILSLIESPKYMHSKYLKNKY